MKRTRKYHVVAFHGKGVFTWTSFCKGFLPWSSVSAELVEEWRKYATKEKGVQCTIISWNRVI